MKVGLVPLLYDEYNYGGVLQFFALQDILKKNDIECEIIYFDNNELVIENDVKGKKGFSFFKKRIYKIINIRQINDLYNIMKRRKKKIDGFKSKFYCPIVCATEINYLDYAAVVCGSDQIWNPSWAKKRSFLAYVPDDTKKVIYGASFGRETMSQKEKNAYKPLINRLEYISVREYSGKKLLETFLDRRDVQVVLDPTLLLMPKEWEKIAKTPSYSDYIFTYFLGPYEDRINYLTSFAKEKNLKILNIPYAAGDSIDKNNFGDYRIADADPSEFIGMIKNAKYIFTDSFHACVFSVLFKKEFFVFQRSNDKKMYGRIDTLISNFELPDRKICINDDISKYPQIDYSKNDNIQEKLRKHSIKYLIGSVTK